MIETAQHQESHDRPAEERADAPTVEAPMTFGGGRYVVREVVGEGAMAITYRALDRERGEVVALKRFFPSRLAALKDLELFMREAALLERLDHPRIPAYRDAFHEEEEGEEERGPCYFLAQEFIDGETLGAALRRGQRFSVEEVGALGLALLEVLEHLHGLAPQVVHRDLKPENIILDAQGQPYLVDFGAVHEVVRLTMRGGSTIVGTFGYMAPEQLMGKASPPTDLYALGVTMLECLTRRTPDDLHGEDTRRMIDGLHAPEAFRAVLWRLCAPRLGERYPSAAMAREDLESALAGRGASHAAQLSTALATRADEDAQVMRRVARLHRARTVASLVKIGLTAALGLGLLLVVVLNVQLGAGFLIALGLSCLGVVGNLALLTARFTHDTWEGPRPGWVHAKARVTRVRNEVDEMTGRPVWYLDYEFPARGGKHTGSIECRRLAIARRHQPGETFSVFYPPGKPHLCEIEDILAS